MFLDFYGLKEQPFGVTPDPRFLYLSPAHREAMASLYYGVETGRGFLALIAKPGLGKTTLLFDLLERLRSSARTAFLFQTQCTSREFMRFLFREVGFDRGASDDIVDLHDGFNRCLLQEAKAGRRFVVVIDEAQNLDASVLETVRLLSDFETPSAKLMQIVLSGQPELADKLAAPQLNQLRQRVSLLCRLQPLSPREVEAYVQHRLLVAGHETGAIFTSEALALVASLSEGTPRAINNLCFSALSLGCALEEKIIGPEIVREVFSDMDVSAMRATRAAEQYPGTFQSFSEHKTLPAFAQRHDSGKGRAEELLSPADALAFLRKVTEMLNQLQVN